jgi:hypothetical protein
VAAAGGDRDAPAVGVGQIVESQETARAPANHRDQSLICHRFDLDIAGTQFGGRATQEAIAVFLGLEVGTGPLRELSRRGGFLFSRVQCNSLPGGGSIQVSTHRP